MLPFRFKRADGSRTSHALVFVSKDIRGYTIMKDIMARESSTEDEGVPSFAYSPADARTPLLFSLNQPLSTLAENLTKRFAGSILTMKDLYEAHHINTPFIRRNYSRVLNEMEADGRIVADPPAKYRPMRAGERTFADRVKVIFQPRPQRG